jgi:hypothetical protein
MKKIITISGKEYTMKSSAYTQFKYKNDTGRRMLQDLQELAKLQDASEEDMIGGIDELTEIVLKMAYVMIEEADSSQVKGYDEFLKSIENLYENTDWISEVIELATSPISRGI